MSTYTHTPKHTKCVYVCVSMLFFKNQLTNEIQARSDPAGLQLVREQKLPELVSITFSP